MKAIIFLLLLLLGISSCSKEKVELTYSVQDLPNAGSLNEILFISQDTGFAASGKVFEPGTLWKTTDGGLTWDTIITSKWGVRNLAYQKPLLLSHDGIIHFYKYTNDQIIAKNQSLEWEYIWKGFDFREPNNIIIVGNTNFHIGRLWILDRNGYPKKKMELEHELQEVLFTNDSTVYAIGYGLVMRSTDRGQNFIPYPELKGDFFRSVSFPTEKVGYIIGEYGTILKTEDYGNTWRKLATGNTVLNEHKRLMKVQFTSEDNGYIVGNNGLFWITNDGAKTWKQVTNLIDIDFTCIQI
ncbi:MAG: YCF48-related protein, partial [Saprospiraceae bacterium]|nr:YCF48-related protein [Saprospiraceae bacterium]